MSCPGCRQRKELLRAHLDRVGVRMRYLGQQEAIVYGPVSGLKYGIVTPGSWIRMLPEDVDLSRRSFAPEEDDAAKPVGTDPGESGHMAGGQDGHR